ncbi:subclass B1 metallo-beta-lactamase [Winogradskyella flava]|uniref:beta-lactamase n=1 Tax=Winogradskyella flava TaxID=1884876 RepID=A0A842IUX0_9FLAO|nr:subclass B1 metallo-beta-lactamase [Winogradskyella flava]MBC2846771.1 subclass B1 metallo-beta-lactamase [Winogradskyella flava]
MLKRVLQIVLVISSFIGCKKQPSVELYESKTLKIEKINDKLYRHISYLQTNDFGMVPCNGLVYINNNEAIVFDTPANNSASKELIEIINKKNKIKAVVATHFHIDCLAGLNEFHKKKIKSYANNLTIALAKQPPNNLPQNGFDNKFQLTIGNETIILQFFGEGHTKDNIVAYLPSEKAMFGGCLVKSLSSTKGNLEDADTIKWSNTIKKIKREFIDLDIVVPGHGKTGGMELLDYTEKLFEYNNDF